MAKKQSRGSEREIVLDLLLEIEREEKKGGAYAGALLKSYPKLQAVSRKEQRAFIRRLAGGVVERRMTLDYVIDLFARTGTAKMKPVIRALLRMGVYQILFMDRVPDAAAVSECVKLAEARGFQKLKGFVNGVLRTVVREKGGIEFPDISIRYSVPKWICDKLAKDCGAGRVESILAAFAKEHPLTLHLDERMTFAEQEALCGEIAAVVEREAAQETEQETEQESGITAGPASLQRHPLHPSFVTVRGAGNPARLPGYGEGQFFIQDAAAGLTVACAGLRPGDTVIDVCASPGGKTMHAAMLLQAAGNAQVENARQAAGDARSAKVLQASGEKDAHADRALSLPPYRVIARDKSAEKCGRIRENVARMRLSGVEILPHDATVRDAQLAGIADVLLLDVPCSGLGVIGRKHEIRYRVQPEDIASLSALQREIVAACADYVKPGGTLMYSTCTLTREENEEMAAWIGRTLPFTAAPLQHLPEALRGQQAEAPSSIRILPDQFGTDGFFIARFIRKP